MIDEKKKSSVSFALTVHSLGIIFGDIGTSPLYVLETIFSGEKTLPTESQCIGAVSLIIWSLILVVSVKYCLFILLADHQGEGLVSLLRRERWNCLVGGIFALCALLTGKSSRLNKRVKSLIHFVSILSASFLIGDGALTPAVSVLSAVEGLALNAPNLRRWVVPITVGIIFGLFLCQQWGTAKIGTTFGPLMLVWFLCLFSVGLWRIRLKPSILHSFNPWKAILFLFTEKNKSFLRIGGVFLSVTGCEALYADLGHFGLCPVRTSWFCLVFPSVVVNYLGQGAFLIHHPQAIENPFYRSLPWWSHWPMVILATIATIIASQAIITGCFSLLSQATSLGYCPPLRVEHTSRTIYGQIYVPSINWTLMLLTMLMTVYFRSSSRLTNAYGLTVCCDSVITTVLYLLLLRCVWNRHWMNLCFFSLFLLVDLLFLFSNLLKFLDGAWIAIVISLLFFILSLSWFIGEGQAKKISRLHSSRSTYNDLPMRCGRRKQRLQSILLVNDQEISSSEDEEHSSGVNALSFIVPESSEVHEEEEEEEEGNVRSLSVVPYVGCFLTESLRETPDAFEDSVRLLHSRGRLLIFVKIENVRIPRVSKAKRLRIKFYDEIYSIRARFGYAEKGDQSLYEDILLLAKEMYHLPIPTEENQVTIFLSHQTIRLRPRNLLSSLWNLPLRIYSLEKSLVDQHSTLIRINPTNTIQLGTIIEL